MRGRAALLALASCLGAQTAGTVDWHRFEPELLGYFSTLLKIDTSNPPGNETAAIRAIQAVFEREGIASRTFALNPARANLVARIKGDGSRRPLLLMAHTDVVGVERARWSVDPFAALRKGDTIFGRGATDDKNQVAAAMAVMVLLQRRHVKLARDVIFLAEAGEEGTNDVGIDFMVREHWREIECEFALSEGGSIVESDGAVRYVFVTTAEKVPRGIRLVAHGTAGHGSRPTPDNAVLRLAQAVTRAGNWRTPPRLNETTRAYFERLAEISSHGDRERYRGILDAAGAPAIDRYFRLYDPGHYSLLHTSVAPTILKGGFRSNVIPSVAEAYLDVRALPDENMPRFLNELRRVIADPAVDIVPSPAGRPVARPSRLDSEMYRALESVSRSMFSAPAIPGMLTGATDNAQLRARGVEAYGIGHVVSTGQPPGGAHADDERISVRSLSLMTEFLWNAVLRVGAK